jgi:hypothetical protein
MGSNQTFLSLFTICSLAILANLFLGFLAHCTLIPQYCTLHTAHCTIHNPQYQCPFRLDIYLLKFDFWFRNGQIGGPRGCYSSFFSSTDTSHFIWFFSRLFFSFSSSPFENRIRRLVMDGQVLHIFLISVYARWKGGRGFTIVTFFLLLFPLWLFSFRLQAVLG